MPTASDDLEVEDRVEVPADLRQHRVERIGLRKVARESVEDEPVGRIVLRQPLADQRRR